MAEPVVKHLKRRVSSGSLCRIYSFTVTEEMKESIDRLKWDGVDVAASIRSFIEELVKAVNDRKSSPEKHTL